MKAAAQVLNTLWQYRDLRSIYKKVTPREQWSRREHPSQHTILITHCSDAPLFIFSSNSAGWVESEPFYYTRVHAGARPIQVTPFSVHHQPTDVTHHSVRSVGICVAEHGSERKRSEHELTQPVTSALLTATFFHLNREHSSHQLQCV